MSHYQAPLRDMRFVIHELVGSGPVCALPAYADCDAALIDAVLEEAARFAGDVLSPLNPVGDRDGARWLAGADGKGEVRTAAGFADAYRQFAEGGWMALPCPPDHGGQGLPRLLAVAVSEMWKSANLSFSHVITLTHGAIEALLIAGSDEMKATWLPRLVSGEWTGTMNITEPQAGSDLAAIACRALPQADGSYRLSGQKIFITYGDHDMAANIAHLVLARTPDAPAGVKGLSLFLVPKYLLDESGNPGEHNDVYCTSIEHKLGVHGSPTTTLVHGDHGGSTGYLIGELAALPNKPKFVAIATKADLVEPSRMAQHLIAIQDLQADLDIVWEEIVPVSALTSQQVGLLTDLLIGLLPEGPSFYPDGEVTDEPEETLIAELIREAALEGVRDELPHSIAVVIGEIMPRPDRPEDKPLTDVFASIVVERESQKGIIIGHKGARLREIGTTAREQINRLLGTRVHLNLHVKVLKEWQRDAKYLNRLGF